MSVPMPAAPAAWAPAAETFTASVRSTVSSAAVRSVWPVERPPWAKSSASNRWKAAESTGPGAAPSAVAMVKAGERGRGRVASYGLICGL